jgi:hypothetical protein
MATNKGGRPKKVIDYALVEKLATIQCTQEEIANILEVSTKTLQRDEEFCRIHKKGIEQGKSSLRRLQWKSAETGNTSMLIWLGKQYLAQREPKQELELDTNKEVIQQIQELTNKL